MTFLAKLGRAILNIIGITQQVLPLIQPQLSTIPGSQVVVDKMNQAFNAVITAEQMFAAANITKSGPQKLEAAKPFIAALVQSVEVVAGKKPKNETLFEDAIGRMTSAMADVLNSFE